MPTFRVIYAYMGEHIQMAAFATPWPGALDLHPSTELAHRSGPYNSEAMRIDIPAPLEDVIYANSSTSSIHSPEMGEANTNQNNLSGFVETTSTQAAKPIARGIFSVVTSPKNHAGIW
ncbi:hypothetical protein D9613_008481 [Agrocybe pediades]|uniref:Uncharacterized protein n=1 Tax=Agrocybe pediades TaxID=84607 RepID=A0A8H4VNZ8_9AGAR|nr:hypothetical protein D9613_008481 [Agrocybe pediades]